MSVPGDRPKPGTGWAVAAFVVGALFAVVSLYWAVGGSALLDTVGGALEAQGRAGNPALIAVVWVSVALKLVAAVVGVVVVRRWFPGLIGRLAVVVAWTAAVILTAYGGLLTVGGLLVVSGVIHASPDADLRAIRWHAFLWDPWFLIWGVLLSVALIQARQRSPNTG